MFASARCLGAVLKWKNYIFAWLFFFGHTGLEKICQQEEISDLELGIVQRDIFFLLSVTLIITKAK